MLSLMTTAFMLHTQFFDRNKSRTKSNMQLKLPQLAREWF